MIACQFNPNCQYCRQIRCRELQLLRRIKGTNRTPDTNDIATMSHSLRSTEGKPYQVHPGIGCGTTTGNRLVCRSLPRHEYVKLQSERCDLPKLSFCCTMSTYAPIPIEAPGENISWVNPPRAAHRTGNFAFPCIRHRA